MTIQLPPQTEALIDEQIASGRYASAAAVIAAAVDMLADDDRRRRHLQSLLAAAEEETARGEVVAWTPQLRRQIREEAAGMVRQGTEPDPDVCP